MAVVRHRSLQFVLWVIVASIAALTSSVSAQDQCRACHEALGDAQSTLFKNDIHDGMGLSCADCHGGNPKTEDMEAAMNKAAGYIGVPKGDGIVKACARCHSSAPIMVKKFHSLLPLNQAELLSTSVHGTLSTTGKEAIAACTNCHGAHGILKKVDPASSVNALNLPKTCAKCHSDARYMRTYNPALPIDQYDKYRMSVHGKRNISGDSKAAECANCHGSHGILSAKDVRSSVYPTNIPATCGVCHSDAQYMRGYGIPSDQLEKFTRSVHGVALLQKKDLGAPACNKCHGNHGATPPGVESISKVCGTCHALNADLFSKSPHKKAFDQKNLPECETCHGNHDIIVATNKLLGVTQDAVCSRCHGESQNPKGYAAAKNMRALIDTLESQEQAAIALVAEAEQKGMEISEAKFKLRDAHQARLESRTMVHSFNEERFKEVVDKGLGVTAVVREEATAALDEYIYRRLGLGLATLAITILVVSLYLYIRKIERRQATGAK